MHKTMPAAMMTLLALSSFAFAAADPKATAPPEPADMKPLFNGKDLAGWDGDPRLWSVKDGAIRGEATPENPCSSNTFLVFVGDQGAGKPVIFKDFELRLSFKIDHGNAGVQYRSSLVPPQKINITKKIKKPGADAVEDVKETIENRWIISGYQAEVANSGGAAGFLYHEKGRGSLVTVGQKVVIAADGKKEVVGSLGDKDAVGKTYKKSDWNEYVIRCEGNHVQHWLNGIQTVDLVDNQEKPAPGKDGKPGSPLQARCMEGAIALQIHSGPPMWVEYSKVRIKELNK